jgi:hypothetical protein
MDTSGEMAFMNDAKTVIARVMETHFSFGTFTGSADVPITGSVEIKDLSGNVRKIAIVA